MRCFKALVLWCVACVLGTSASFGATTAYWQLDGATDGLDTVSPYYDLTGVGSLTSAAPAVNQLMNPDGSSWRLGAGDALSDPNGIASDGTGGGWYVDVPLTSKLMRFNVDPDDNPLGDYFSVDQVNPNDPLVAPFLFKRDQSFTVECFARANVLQLGQFRIPIISTAHGASYPRPELGWDLSFDFWGDTVHFNLIGCEDWGSDPNIIGDGSETKPLRVRSLTASVPYGSGATYNHIAAVWDADAGPYGEMRLYVNNKLAAARSGDPLWTWTGPGLGGNVCIAQQYDSLDEDDPGSGYDYGYRSLDGLIDEIRFVNEALGIDDMLDVPACGKAGFGAPTGDISGDCMVLINDFGFFATDWMQAGDLPGDLNDDDMTDYTDLGIFSGNWLVETDFYPQPSCCGCDAYAASVGETVAYYQFDDDSGTRCIADAVGHIDLAVESYTRSFAYVGAIANPDAGPFVVGDPDVNVAAAFNPICYTGVYQPAFDVTDSQSWTFECWANPAEDDPAEYADMVLASTAHLATNGIGWTLMLEEGGDLVFRNKDASGTVVEARASGINYQEAGGPDMLDYIHVAAVWDHDQGTYGQLRLYVDGQLRATADPTQSAANGNDANRRFAIGGWDMTYSDPIAALYDDDTWYGRIDEVRFVSTALAPTEFLNYRDPVAAAKAYYQLDDTSGADAYGNHDLTESSPGTTYPQSGLQVDPIPNPDSDPDFTGNSAANPGLLNFNTNGGYYSAGIQDPFLVYADQPFTVEGWARCSSGGLGYIVGNYGASSNYSGFYVYRLNDDIAFAMRLNGSSVEVSTAVPLYTLFHFAAVWDPTGGSSGLMRLYIDGQEVATAAGKPVWDNSGQGGDFQIGGRNWDSSPGWKYDGRLDEIRFVSQALTPADFLNYTPPVVAKAYYEFDSDPNDAYGNYDLTFSTPGTVYPQTTYQVDPVPNPDIDPDFLGDPCANPGLMNFNRNGGFYSAGITEPFKVYDNKPFTVEGWARCSEYHQSEPGYIVGNYGASSSYRGFYLLYFRGELKFEMNLNGQAVNVTQEVAHGQMFHYAAVWDPSAGSNGEMRLYIDGKNPVTSEGNPAWDNSGQGGYLQVGGRNWETGSPSNRFNGRLDEIRFVDQALMPTQFLNYKAPWTWTEDFNAYADGSIFEQGGWTNLPGHSTMQIGGPVNWDGLGDGRVVKPWTTSGSGWIMKDAGFDIGIYDVIALEFDVYIRTTDPSRATMAVCVGDGVNAAPLAGLWGGKFMIREANNGAFTYAKDVAGNDILPNAQDVYRIRSEWDFDTGQATLYYKNLSNGDTEWTQLYFDAAQTDATASLGSVNAPDMTHAMLRAYAYTGELNVEGDNLIISYE